jgi:hypothetical protein
MNRNELIEAGADEIQYIIEWCDRSTAYDMAERIFDVWDKAYGAFDTYDEYDGQQLDLFDTQGDLFDERQSV